MARPSKYCLKPEPSSIPMNIINFEALHFKFKKNIDLKYSETGVSIISDYKHFSLEGIRENCIQLFKKMRNTYLSTINITAFVPEQYLKQLIILDIFEYGLIFDNFQIYFNTLPNKINDFSDDELLIAGNYVYSYIDAGTVIYERPLNKFQIKSTSNILELFFAHLKKQIKFIELHSILNSFYKDLSRYQLSFILNLLIENKLIIKCNCAEETSTSLNRWERQDLLFHMKSRVGFHDNPVGRTYPFKKNEPPFSARKDLRKLKYEDAIILSKPEWEVLNIPLKEVLQKRTSTRKYGIKPISLDQLSKFLYYSHSVHTTIPVNENQLYESSKRSYPSGGGSYSLEIYAIVNRSESLAAGVYYYCPYEHSLFKVKHNISDYNKILLDAKYANGSHELPDILLVITSRFGRMNWKYQTMAYSAILKDVGALFMTMYCVATALNIGICALGCGDIATFKNIIKNEIWEESSVGEIIIGSIA